ncbi:MAG: FkbM family methyltransferase, partial [Thermofilaceae archaeon]
MVINVLTKLLQGKSLLGMLPDGNLLLYPLDDFKLLSIISEVYQKRIYDVNGMESFYCICDVGAHIGLFTLRISKKNPKSKIIAIEPHPINFQFLMKNIIINGLKERVYPLNV